MLSKSGRRWRNKPIEIENMTARQEMCPSGSFAAIWRHLLVAGGRSELAGKILLCETLPRRLTEGERHKKRPARLLASWGKRGANFQFCEVSFFIVSPAILRDTTSTVPLSADTCAFSVT